jgi:serine/threonine-protein kinase
MRLQPRAASRLGKLVADEHDRELGRLAVRRGLITEDRLEAALAEKTPLSQWIPPSDYDALVEEKKAEDCARLALSRGPVPPEEARRWADDPQRNLGEYVLTASLGKGGGGEVWKAWDRRLGRWAAVKRPELGPESGPTIERFYREAQAAARLTHPNIVPIFRIGQERGRPYIAMQLIDGKPLSGADLDLTQALQAVRTAALAVHYAHQQGVVHRDLKPGNIMTDGRGGVWVVDFGLAHLSEASRAMTTTGCAVGTPAYMSPEQARGEPSAREPATDVYSLGATLYELVTGRRPFEADTVASIVHQVVNAEPVPPLRHRPDLPEAVQTIVLKAMDKSPARRYGSASELAEDLARFLEGEPILARPEGSVSRIGRRIRKNPLPWALAAVGAVAVLAIFFAARSRQEREAALEMMRDAARGSLQMALKFRREGNIQVMGQALEVLESAHRRAVGLVPAHPEVDYLMGRMHRALMQEDKALEYQERALSKDPNFAPARYERAVLRSRLYGEELARAAELVGKSARRSNRDLERANPGLEKLRREILDDCDAIQRSDLGGARADAARGILAYYADQLEKARAALESAVAADPLMEEAWQTLAKTFAQQAIEAGAMAEKEEKWKLAEAACTRGLELDRGYLPHLIERAGLRLNRARARASAGGDTESDWSAAESDYDRILSMDRDSWGAYAWRASLRSNRAMHRMDSGKDPFADLEAAERDAREAVKLKPERPFSWCVLGGMHTNRALAKLSRGEDPEADFVASEKAYTEALRLEPRYLQGGVQFACALLNRASAKLLRGLDPSAEFARSEKLLGEMLEIDPRSEEALISRGALRSNRGGWKFGRGEDPLPDYDSSEEDYGQALKIDPKSAEALFKRGHVRNCRAVHLNRQGLEPAKFYAAAENDLSAALESEPASPEIWMERGLVKTNRAVYRLGRGEDARDDLRGAIADLERAVELNPRLADGWMRLGRLRWESSAILKDPGADAQAEKELTRAVELNPASAEAWRSRAAVHRILGRFDRFEEDIERALRINPSQPDLLVEKGSGRLRQGELKIYQGLDPSEDLDGAERDYLKAIEINPRLAAAWIGLSNAHNYRGKWLMDQGRDALERFDRADGALQQALKINPRDASAHTGKGMVLNNRSVMKAKRGLDPLPDIEAAEKCLREALKLNPRSASGWIELAGILTNLGTLRKSGGNEEFEGAFDCLGRALELEPENAAALSRRGALNLNLGNSRAYRGEDPLASWAAAEEDLTRAIERDPKKVEARIFRVHLLWNRAAYLETLGDARAHYGRVVSELDELLRLFPSVSPQFAALRNRAQGKAK